MRNGLYKTENSNKDSNQTWATHIFRRQNVQELGTEKIWRVWQTINWVAVIDIAITKRSTGGQIPANPNRNHLPHLIKKIVELRIGDVDVKISNIQGGRDMLICRSIGGRIGTGVGNLRLRWNLSHGEKKTRWFDVFSFLFFQKFFRFFLIFDSLPSPLLFRMEQ